MSASEERLPSILANVESPAEPDPSIVRPVLRCVGDKHDPACGRLREEIVECARNGAQVDLKRRSVCPLMLAEVIRTATERKFASIHIANAVVAGALDLRLATCGSLVLKNCDVWGSVNLSQASATGVTFEGGSVEEGIVARELTCTMGVQVVDVMVAGSIDVTNAFVDGDFSCRGTHLGGALLGDGLKCEGNVLLGASGDRKFRAAKGVRLVGAKLGGAVDLRGAELIAADGPQRVDMTERARHIPKWKDVRLTREIGPSDDAALCADMLQCEGSVLLDGAICTGDVRLVCAKIGAQLLARDMTGAGSVWCNALECPDVVCFDRMYFGAAPPTGRGMAFSGARINGRLQVTETKLGWLSLLDARVGNFVDDATSRPKAGFLVIDGFSYERITDTEHPRDGIEEKEFDARLAWIELQTPKRSRSGLMEWLRGSEYGFLPAPYTTLADFLDRRGRPPLATRVRIRREALRARQSGLGVPRTMWSMLLAITVRYGFRPQTALFWLAGMPLLYGTLNFLRSRPGEWDWPTSFAECAARYWKATQKVFPIPSSFPQDDGAAMFVAALTLLLSTVGIAGLLNLLGKK